MISNFGEVTVCLFYVSGNAGDSLNWHRNQPFSTRDQDNDQCSCNCAILYEGAWWYSGCHHSNLNGFYHRGSDSPHGRGVNWLHWRGHNYSLKRTEMKIRPMNYWSWLTSADRIPQTPDKSFGQWKFLLIFFFYKGGRGNGRGLNEGNSRETGSTWHVTVQPSDQRKRDSLLAGYRNFVFQCFEFAVLSRSNGRG